MAGPQGAGVAWAGVVGGVVVVVVVVVGEWRGCGERESPHAASALMLDDDGDGCGRGDMGRR
jgi:hypothetical protein